MTDSPRKINLLGMGKAALEEFVTTKLGEKRFRATQLIKWIHQQGVDDFSRMTDISKSLRERLQGCAEILPPEVTYRQYSADGTRKWIMKMPGGSAVETVFIPEEGRGTLCVSSQIGCALDCSFCATGKQGFNRDLTAAEIIGQLWVAVRSFHEPGDKPKRPISNVVMMGMGEPLLNFANVIESVNLMLDDNAYGLSKRRVTISTSGVVPRIRDLIGVTDASLALSLHAPNDGLRDQLVPLNRRYGIAETLAAVMDYFSQLPDKRVVTIEYTLLDQTNDTPQLAAELAALLTKVPCKINLIPFNPFPHSGYRRPSNNRIHRFREILQQAGYQVTVRKTRGDDIAAACGQLVGEVADKTRRAQKFITAVELGHSAASVAERPRSSAL